MKNKTILITGGTGFLGKNLVRKLQQMDNRVIATGYSEAGIKGFERKHYQREAASCTRCPPPLMRTMRN